MVGDPNTSPSAPRNGPYPNSLAHAVRVHELSRCLNFHALCLTSTWLSQILHGRLRHPRTYPQPHLLSKTSLSLFRLIVPYSQSLTDCSLQTQLAVFALRVRLAADEQYKDAPEYRG